MENKEIQIHGGNKGIINIIDNGYNLILGTTLFYTLRNKKEDKKYKKLAFILYHVILKNYNIINENYMYNVDYMLYKLAKYYYEE